MTRTRPTGAPAETVLYESNIAMFGNDPVRFLALLMLTPMCGLGLIGLALWWLQTKGMRLTVTNRRTTLRCGLASKFTTEVRHEHVRNVQVKQGALQRIFGVGAIGVSSAGQ